MRKGKRIMFVFATIIVIVVTLLALFWLGMQIKPSPFPDYAAAAPPMETTISIPDDLPAPVARYFRTIAGGDEMPQLNSCVLTGRAKLRINGISMQARIRFIYDINHGYRHYIETTVFNRPFLKVHETYLDGVGRMELPMGTVEDDPRINAAANQGLWAEYLWMPSAFLSDSRVRWEAIDDTSARLFVPFGAEEQEFTAFFDTDTGLIDRLETMRFRTENDEQPIHWTVAASEWKVSEGILLPGIGTAEWANENGPWATFIIEDATFNTDVSSFIFSREH